MTDWNIQQMIKAAAWPLAPALLAPGGDFNAPVEGGLVPLHWACQEGKAGLVAYMIAQGADVSDQTQEGRTMLELAVDSGSFQVVMMLIDQLKATAVAPPDGVLRDRLVQAFRKGHPNLKNRLSQTLRDWDRIQRQRVSR